MWTHVVALAVVGAVGVPKGAHPRGFYMHAIL